VRKSAHASTVSRSIVALSLISASLEA
jgi:hypothetical protein